MTKALLKRLEEGKLYYSISEVCQITGLEQHVLRYWESEFPQLKPRKNRSGNRAYRSKEIKLIRYIKYLLYDEQYTVQGAKRKIAEASSQDLEGQVNLLGALPGIGAAAPQAAISTVATPPRRLKPKNSVPSSEAPSVPPVNVPVPENAATSLQPSVETQQLLLQLRDELKSVLQTLQGKTR